MSFALCYSLSTSGCKAVFSSWNLLDLCRRPNLGAVYYLSIFILQAGLSVPVQS